MADKKPWELAAEAKAETEQKKPWELAAEAKESSPKSAEPSTQGGKSGSVKPQTPPLTSTSASDVTKLGSLGQQILPQSLGGKQTQTQVKSQAPAQPLIKSQDELNFEEFYKTLPSNLKNSDNYNLKGYWESLGKPKAFDYSQPKERDGHYHAFSRNPNTGEILKSENHPTFKQALMEDEKAGYKAYKSPEGKVYTFGEDDVVPSGYKPYDWKKAPEPKIAGTITTPVLKIAGLEEPKVIPKSYAPTVQENIAKIEGMTLKTKFPEYAKPSEAFDFKKASAEAVSEEEKARQQQNIQRKEQRRLESLPQEIEKLRSERSDLLLDKSVEGRKKLAANEAVTKNMEIELENANKSQYKSLENLNQGAVKGLGKEVFDYLQENPKLNDKVKAVGLNDNETYNLIQNAVSRASAPLVADLETFKNEGTVGLAAKKINASNALQAKQTEIQGLGDELKTFQDNYLKKNGFSALTEQFNQAQAKLNSYAPAIEKVNKEAVYYQKELKTLGDKINSYSSKIKDGSFDGTQAEYNEYQSLVNEYNDSLNDLNNLSTVKYKNELAGYENARTNYNTLLAKRNSVVDGLNNSEYGKIKAKYDAAILEYDNVLEGYKRYEEPAIKDRINQYFSTVTKLGEYDNKLKAAKGAMPSIEELENAKKAFDNTGLGGDVLDIGGRAVNSILSASAKLVASPFRLAASLSDVSGTGSGVYHYTDYIADLIEGTGKEPLFMTKKSNDFYNAEKDEINWGVVPALSGLADQLGILLTLAVTGKYAAPVLGESFAAEELSYGSLIKQAEAVENAKIATSIAPAFLISYGDSYKEALDKGFSSGGAMAYGTALSFLEGLTELIIPDKELVFGKDAKDLMLNRFIKDYAKGKKYAVKRLTEDFLYNALGESTEEGLAAIGQTIATTIGHLVDKDIQVDIPTVNQNISTIVTSGIMGGGMGILGQVSEESNMYKMAVVKFAKDFQTGKDLLDALNKKGKIDDKRYNKLITDVQKYQSVVGNIPQGLSEFKTKAIADKMIDINELYSQMNKDEKNPINKINKKKIDAIQNEIEAIIDDKDFDKKFNDKLNEEAEEMKKKAAPEVTIEKYTASTPEKYGYIDRGDGKGKVELTEEEFLAEQAKMQPQGEQLTTTEEKQNEKEPTKTENGEPMPTGVQGVRTEGEGGKESTELRAEKEKVADPLKDVESTAKALEGTRVAPLEALFLGEIAAGKIEGKTPNQVIAEAYHKSKADGSNPQLVEAVEKLLKPTEEKVSGGLTQGEKTNLETIAKEAGVNFQEVRNVYNKYGEGKPLSEITLEDYQKAQEKRQKGGTEEKVPPAGKRLFNEPNLETAEISKQFKKDNGIDTPEGERITEIDEENSKRIADAYEEMEDSPDDPIVQKAYEELADQTAEQHKAIMDAGYEVELWEGEGEPYKNAQEMIDDLRNNKHMYIFSTEAGFGENPITDKQRKQNKMLQDSGFKDKNGKPLLYNDVFRFVHDFFGHSERGNAFGAKGEENAWDVHYRMYKSPLARRALTTETRGQNSWVNFGKHLRNPDGSIKTAKDQGYIPPRDRPFAEQKMGLLPEWASENKYLEKDLEKQKSEKPETKKPEGKEEPTGLTKEEQQELDSLNGSIKATLNNIEDLKADIEIEKGNLKEEKERIRKEIAKVRASKMGRAGKAERIEELKAELQDKIDEIEGTIEINKDDIASEKADLREYEKQKAKLEKKKKAAKPEAEKEGEPTKTTEDAVQEPSTEEKVPPAGEGREDLTEGGEGVGQGKQGEKAPQKSPKEVIQDYVDAFEQVTSSESTGSEKRIASQKMRDMLDGNPNIKRIFDNIKGIHKSLEQQGLIRKTKGCP